jgi:hypothetical protein
VEPRKEKEEEEGNVIRGRMGDTGEEVSKISRLGETQKILLRTFIFLSVWKH